MTVTATPRPRDLLTGTVRFCRLLRARGLAITPSESHDAVRALEVVDLGDRAEVHRALRTVLATRPEEFPVFDATFDAFWGGLVAAAAAPGEGLAGLDIPQPDAHFPRAKDAALDFSGWTDVAEGEGEPVGLPGVSDLESTMGKDFSSFGAVDLAEVERLAAQIARRLATRRSRRLKPSRRRGRVDLRRTVRLSLTRGELIDLARRERKIQKTKLVILCDVSGSMDLYSRLLLQFLYAMQNHLGRMETFVFSTRLHRITEDLRHSSYRGALARLGDVRDWSGGTKIGESLRAFNAGVAETPRPRHRGHRALRRLGHGRPRDPRGGAPDDAPARGQAHLAEPAPREPRLPAADAGHAGRAAARGRVPAGPQPRLVPSAGPPPQADR